jgi:hypothetical protein
MCDQRQHIDMEKILLNHTFKPYFYRLQTDIIDGFLINCQFKTVALISLDINNQMFTKDWNTLII